ncbi:PEP-CTERM sorting domain-containing protein [Roseateles saccharophilus]|nr:PEP-CTERM sorting domain-containing protein [Roseateles saccharophilus]MDG0831339.1 PEP-CTERM sorting domain-containing protein [Roseateles saccharophilus]
MDITKLAGALVAAGAAAGVSAAPVTVSQTLNLGQLLNGGGTGLHFDLGSTLSGQNLESQQVLSGSLQVYGVSDASYGSGVTQYGSYMLESQTNFTAFYQYGGGGYFVCTSYSWWSGGCSGGYYVPAYYYPVQGTNRTFLRSDNVLYSDNTVDTMSVHAGNTTQTGSDSSVSNSATAYGPQVFAGQSGNGMYGTDTYYDQSRNVYHSVSGALSVDMTLDSLALASFATAGTLDASVFAQTGQFRLDQAVLTLQVDDTPSGRLPEPATLALTATAALGLAAARRRRRQE